MKAGGTVVGRSCCTALLVVGLGGPVLAQSVEPTLTEEQRVFEGELQDALVCVCGTCPHLSLSTCTCPDADRTRHQLATQVALGKNREGIFQYFIETYGSQEPLGAPRGAFNQLVWLFPFAAGGVVLVLIGGFAGRSSRRREEHPDPAVAEPIDAQLDARLDDELRNLD